MTVFAIWILRVAARLAAYDNDDAKSKRENLMDLSKIDPMGGLQFTNAGDGAGVLPLL